MWNQHIVTCCIFLHNKQFRSVRQCFPDVRPMVHPFRKHLGGLWALSSCLMNPDSLIHVFKAEESDISISLNKCGNFSSLLSCFQCISLFPSLPFFLPSFLLSFLPSSILLLTSLKINIVNSRARTIYQWTDTNRLIWVFHRHMGIGAFVGTNI